MSNESRRIVGWLALLLAAGFFAPRVWGQVAELPARPEMKQIEPGVWFGETKFDGSGPGKLGRLWIYLPQEKAPPKALICVFIAPGETNMISGKKLKESNRAEHLPYVRAGMAVIAYDLDGEPP